MQEKSVSVKKIDITKLVLFLALLVIINVVSDKYFFRIDLTQEKLYTVSEQSKEILSDLDDIVYIKVYLDGELTIPLKKFQRSITELLDEFKVYGKRNFNYEFIDAFEDINPNDQQKILTDFASKGLQPINDVYKDADGTTTERYIIPGAFVVYNEIEVPINLLNDNAGKSGEENINSSIINLEYKLISTIRNLSQKEAKKVFILEGHGELDDVYIGDFMNELSKAFTIDRGEILGRHGVLDNYKAILIPQPTKEFSEADKFSLDQYAMQGGKIIWIVDGVNINIDSINTNGQTFAYPNQLNLDDMFFRYGVRLNYHLIEDLQSNFVPMNMALAGSPANWQPVPWQYYPLYSMGEHTPITKNLNMVWSRYASSFDTLGNRKSTQITPLLISSSATRIKQVPTIVSLAEWKNAENPRDFVSGSQIVGLLIEGKFNSVFKNRIITDFMTGVQTNFLENSVQTQMAFIADGDIVKNDVRFSAQGRPMVTRLGYDRYTRQTFGNKEFLSNLVHYMVDEKNLLQLKNKNIKIRLLDRTKVIEQKTTWQIINLFVPVLFALLIGLSVFFIRKKKYTR